MGEPHKHAEIIKAWADGAEIEYLNILSQKWQFCPIPSWNDSSKYRIKPEPKPDVVQYLLVKPLYISRVTTFQNKADNLKLTFDGETGELKKAEVLND
jgi:hypothetical protein